MNPIENLITSVTECQQPDLEKAVASLVVQYFNTVEEPHEGGFLHEELIRRVERELIVQVMEQLSHNQSQTAKALGISRTSLRKKLADNGLI